jgi:hypothetical protein
MQQAYVVTATVTDDHTLALDEALPLQGGRVRVIVEVLERAEMSDHARFMAEMREKQRQRGHVPRSREEVDVYLSAERGS